jgi:hypothetical protein
MTEQFLTALRAGRPQHTPEAEGVIVLTQGTNVILVMDDDERITFDREELIHALEAA